MTAAAEAATAEAAAWLEMARRWRKLLAEEPAISPFPTERDVTGFDPTTDLERRGRPWGYRPDGSLVSLTLFAAGLAQAEAEAWSDDVPDVATRAHETRRHLLGDRVAHWAVPWLDAAGRCYAGLRTAAHADRDLLLELGDRMRLAPALAGEEGRFLPGEDALGPKVDAQGLTSRLARLMGGVVITDATVGSLTAGRLTTRSHLGELLASAVFRVDLHVLYELSAARWRRMATEHPGTAELWLALDARCVETSSQIAALSTAT